MKYRIKREFNLVEYKDRYHIIQEDFWREQTLYSTWSFEEAVSFLERLKGLK